MQLLEIDLGTRLLPYQAGWDLQREVHADVCAGSRPDTVLLCEHESVYTAGKRTGTLDRPTDGTPVVDVDRGGRITWHGPGQLVGYPIVRLAAPIDVVLYVRALEETLIRTCADLGLDAGRVEGRSGVWFPSDAPATPDYPGYPDSPAGPAASRTGARRDRKVAAIGVRVARGVTMHGFALNCEPDLGQFGRIVPCGIDDADVTSLSAETGRRVTIAEVLPLVRAHLVECLAPVLAAGRADASVLDPAR